MLVEIAALAAIEHDCQGMYGCHLFLCHYSVNHLAADVDLALLAGSLAALAGDSLVRLLYASEDGLDFLSDVDDE